MNKCKGCGSPISVFSPNKEFCSKTCECSYVGGKGFGSILNMMGFNK